ncbi:MAG: formylglycine-generating enzyme family protein [Phycisphaerae bacterium]|nr:formylglycine-generating enzyme family protein [Phycisphaerae bacterium]
MAIMGAGCDGTTPVHRPPTLTVVLGDVTAMKLISVSAGTFLMGSSDRQPGHRADEGPQHEVRISKPFYLGVREVTRGQFATFASDTGYKTSAEREGWAYAWDGTKWNRTDGASWRNPGFEQSDEHPVTQVSFPDALAFCAWLSRRTGQTVRLPTEAEWEYACRAGTTTVYPWGDRAEDGAGWANAWDATATTRFPGWAGFKWDDGFACTAPVGLFRANGFGLCDMIGNVWEWCADWRDETYYASSPKSDPKGPDSGSVRVLRGGGWNDIPANCRSAYRYGIVPGDRSGNVGFRIVMETIASPARAESADAQLAPHRQSALWQPYRDLVPVAGVGAWHLGRTKPEDIVVAGRPNGNLDTVAFSFGSSRLSVAANGDVYQWLDGEWKLMGNPADLHPGRGTASMICGQRMLMTTRTAVWEFDQEKTRWVALGPPGYRAYFDAKGRRILCNGSRVVALDGDPFETGRRLLAADERLWGDLVERLDSRDVKVRDAAKNELKKIYPRSVVQFSRAIQDSALPDVRRQVMEAMTEITPLRERGELKVDNLLERMNPSFDPKDNSGLRG